MLTRDHINLIVELKQLTHADIATVYQKKDGTIGISRAYISGLLCGSEELNCDNYFRLMQAINSPNAKGAYHRANPEVKPRKKAQKQN